MSELTLRARLRVRANELAKTCLDSHPPMSREAFVDVVHAALHEAAMIGVREAIEGIYKSAGLDAKGERCDDIGERLAKE